MAGEVSVSSSPYLYSKLSVACPGGQVLPPSLPSLPQFFIAPPFAPSSWSPSVNDSLRCLLVLISFNLLLFSCLISKSTAFSGLTYQPGRPLGLIPFPRGGVKAGFMRPCSTHRPVDRPAPMWARLRRSREPRSLADKGVMRHGKPPRFVQHLRGLSGPILGSDLCVRLKLPRCRRSYTHSSLHNAAGLVSLRFDQSLLNRRESLLTVISMNSDIISWVRKKRPVGCLTQVVMMLATVFAWS
ncbi:hypothetical protein LY78DRAFT_409240 [Colletotrichum sublineola]|nr:hypothetical protein LY78DRAFT_409240 [Colletotrichum sublineola]